MADNKVIVEKQEVKLVRSGKPDQVLRVKKIPIINKNKRIP